MNLKKLFATVAGVSLFAQAVIPTGGVRAASYPSVYQEAYNYAYDVRVTTQSPIDNAGLYRDITRAEAAKMISNRAENVLGREATSSVPTYSDIASLRTSDLYDAIIKAGELGLMNGANGKFRPYDTLTRGEFATIVSRALWGNKYEGGNPYYVNHLNALSIAGIMTVINNPDVNIIRGDVMIMLMRADPAYSDGDSSINCEDLLAVFEKGSAEYEAAKKICEEVSDGGTDTGSSTVVKAGDLDVAVTDYSSTIKSAPAVGTVTFNKVEFRSSQNISLNTITVAIAGLTSRGSIDRVWFERDGVALTSKVRPTTDGTASLTFKGNFAVKSNETLDLVVALSGAAGAEVSFKIASVDSSAQNVNLRNVLSSTYRTTAYKVATLDITTDSNLTAVGSTTSPNSTFKLGSQSSYTIGKLNIQNNGAENEDRIINVKSVLLKNAHSTDLAFLKNIQVLRDGTNVAKNIAIDGRNLQITLNDTIQPGKRAIYTIVAEVGNMTDVPSYVQLQLQAMSDIVADESSTNFRTNNTTSFGINTSTLYFDLYKFEGGKITFANDATFPTVIEAASGANDVVIAAGTLTLSEPISFKAFSLTGTTGDIRKLSLEIGGTRYVAGSTDNGNVRTFEWDEIYVTRTSTVKVIANLETNPSTSISLSPSLISSAIFINGGNYTNTDTNFGANEVAGRIQIAKINVTTPRFALNNNLSTTQNAIVGESASRTIFEGPITSKKNITVDSVTFAIGDIQTGVNFENQNMDLDLYVGNSVIDSKTIKLTPSATVTFNTNIKITETAQTVKIVASLASNGTGRVVATVVANGTDADGNKNSSSPINTVAFRVLPEASVSVTNAGSTSQTVIEGANAQLTEFTASISDGTTNLSKVVISGESLPANTTATLSIGGNTYQSSTATANQIEFSNINASLQEGDYKATITTNVNTDGKLTGTTLKVDQVVLTYTDAASNSKAATGTINATYYFVKAFPVITVASTTTKNQITLKITNGNNSAITISGLHLGGSDATIDGQIISSSHSYTSMVAPVKLDTPRTLAKGESVELVIKASSIETTAKLSAIEYSIVSAGETYNYTLNNTYTNVGKWGEFTVSYSS